MSILDTATAQTVQELTDVITAISAIGICVLLIRVSLVISNLIKDGFFATASEFSDDGMTDQQHYDNAYKNYAGSSFDEFEANYSRSKNY